MREGVRSLDFLLFFPFLSNQPVLAAYFIFLSAHLLLRIRSPFSHLPFLSGLAQSPMLVSQPCVVAGRDCKQKGAFHPPHRERLPPHSHCFSTETQ